ncbi:hypothetical protein SteCoe_28078 [Stentor coeruleus]|uniref:Uncharacterized protein n=1 Tax=Stentor coeruleus TaxID=5963 RepID=A0A1R2B939_9CILI|nr:hypothetical protein SteCoe_28078 [Stentor coeruleus]
MERGKRGKWGLTFDRGLKFDSLRIKSTVIKKSELHRGRKNSLMLIIKIAKNFLRKYLDKWNKACLKSYRREIKLKEALTPVITSKSKLIRAKTVRMEKTCMSSVLDKEKEQFFNSRQNTINKLESTIKMFKFLCKLAYPWLKSSFYLMKILTAKDLLVSLLKCRFKKLIDRFSKSLSLRKLSITTTEYISITPGPRKAENCSVIQESSFNLIPSRNIFSPVNINYRYTNTFEKSPYNSFDLPNLSSLESLDGISFDNNIHNVIKYSEICPMNSHYQTPPQTIPCQDDSLVELEDRYEGIESELSPILMPYDIEIKDNFQLTDPGKSSSSSIPKDLQLQGSKEDTVPVMPYCGKSESIEIVKGIKSLSNGEDNQEKIIPLRIKNDHQKKNHTVISKKNPLSINIDDEDNRKGIQSIDRSIVTLAVRAKRYKESLFVCNLHNKYLRGRAFQGMVGYMKTMKKRYKGLEMLVRLFRDKNLENFVSLQRNLYVN